MCFVVKEGRNITETSLNLHSSCEFLSRNQGKFSFKFTKYLLFFSVKFLYLFLGFFK